MTTTNPIVLLAPAPNMVFAAIPSGTTYVSNQYGLITITNGSVADQQALVTGGGCLTLTAVSGVTGNPSVGASTLAGLYALDVANDYDEGTIAAVFNDSTTPNNGLWAKTGTGTGSGNWTFEQIFITALMPVLSTSTSAGSANATAINDILSVGGEVRIEIPGTYYLSFPLVMGSNTSLFLGPDTTLIQSPSQSSNLIQSACYSRAWNTATLTWTSGPEVSVNWPSHGQVKGNYVWLRGEVQTFTGNLSSGSATISSPSINPVGNTAVGMNILSEDGHIPSGTIISSQSSSSITLSADATANSTGANIQAMADPAFFGVFQIISITDSNDFIVRLNNVPASAPVGNFQVKQADTNIRIEGGTFDYNFSGGAGGGASTDAGLISLLMIGVHQLTIDTNVIDTSKFCVNVGAVDDVDITLRVQETNSDCVKIYGPARGVRVNGLSAFGGDDVISIQPLEPTVYQGYDVPLGGDCQDIRVRNLNAYTLTSGSGIAFYAHPVFTIDAVEIDGISFQSSVNNPVVNIQNASSIPFGKIGRIAIKNLRIPDVAADFNGIISIGGSQTQSIEAVDIEGVIYPQSTPTSYEQNAFAVGSGCSVNNLRLSSVVGDMTGTIANISGTVENFIFEKSSLNCVSPAYAITVGGKLAQGVLRENYVNNWSNLIVVESSASGTPNFVLEKNTGEAVCGVNFSIAGNITVADNQLSGMYNGYARCDGSGLTFNVVDRGNNSYAGSGVLVTKVTGSENVIVTGMSRLPAYTCSALFTALSPSSTAAGTKAFVTDLSATPSFNSTISSTSGGGSNGTSVTCDGTNWRVG